MLKKKLMNHASDKDDHERLINVKLILSNLRFFINKDYF